MADYTLPSLSAVLFLGLAAGGIASALRSLPFPARYATRKPLACPLCMGFWCALFVLALAVILYGTPPGGAGVVFIYLLELAAITAVAAWVNAQVVPPPLVMPGTPLPGERLP